jgi:hypothetical protein
VIDRAVVDFTAGLMDILMELGFSQVLPVDRWRNCSVKLTALAKALGESTPPNWVNPLPQDRHAQVEMLADGNLLITLHDDSEDEDNPSLSMPLDLASTKESAGPSTSTSAIASSHQASDAVDGISHQGLPAGNATTAEEVQHLRKLLKRTRRSLKIAHRMSPALHCIH